MTEENLTKIILAWLEETGWEIVAFDFPQGGGGVLLHPDITARTHKNSGSITPDIIAIKGDKVIVFENKNKFVESDFVKVAYAKSTRIFYTSLQRLITNIPLVNVFWGVGIPFSEKNIRKAKAMLNSVDFVVFVEDFGAIEVVGEQSEIFARP